MRILLLNPPLYVLKEYRRGPVFPYGPPLGVGYLASNLRRHGHDVAAADLTYWDRSSILRKLREASWDVVGVSVLTDQRQGARNLCDDIRRECPGACLVLGGVHPTLMTEQVVNHWDCDVVVVGEGERTMVELVAALERGTDLADVPGVAFRGEEGRMVRTSFPSPIAELDDLPFPSYGDFDLDSYYLFPVFHDLTSRRDSKDSISIITSRGCTARCTFCSTFVVWRKGWRARSPKNVVDEIEMLHRDFGKTFFNFADDLFTVDQDRVIAISQEIIRRKLDIRWDCETRVPMVGPEMLGWMKRAGCHSVAYGVESVGEWVLQRMNKDIQPEQIYQAFRWTREAGINARAMLMIGSRDDDAESIEATCEFIRRARPDTVQAAVTMIFPSTALYQWARRNDFIDDDYWLTDKPAPYNTIQTPLRTLKQWEEMILIEHARGWKRRVRRGRQLIERMTRVRVSLRGIDFFLGEGEPRHLELPGLGRRA